MSRRPTIVIVHGAYHQPEHWHTVAAHLRDAGLKVVLPRLPSVGLSSDPGNALDLDTAAVRNALRGVVIDEGDDAVLVMHSYGGLAGNEGFGMFQEMDHHTRDSSSPQVQRLIYLVAHSAVEKGTILWPEDLDIPHIAVDDKGIMTHGPTFEHFYEGDCSREEAQPAIDMCLPMATSTLRTPTKYAAWKEYGVPCTYIKCLIDRVVTPAMADAQIAKMREAGVDVTVETMGCGHSPAHVAPKELTDLIVRIVGET